MKYVLAVTSVGILLCCGCGENSLEPRTQSEPVAHQEVPQGKSANDAEPLAESPDSNMEGKVDDDVRINAYTKAYILENATMKFIGQLANEQFAEATKGFDDTMKKVMPAEKLQGT